MSKSKSNNLQENALRMTRVGFYFVALYMAIIIVSDAWNLITPEIVIQRWTSAAVMLLFTGAAWYLLKTSKDTARVKIAIWLQIAMYVTVTALTIYAQRGVASRSVLLYAVPLIFSAALASRAAIYATAILAISSYSLVSIRYFYLNYGEAYKVELYGELIFYCGLLFILAALLVAAVRAPDK